MEEHPKQQRQSWGVSCSSLSACMHRQNLFFHLSPHFLLTLFPRFCNQGCSAEAHVLQLWSSSSSCWAWQWAPVSLNFLKGEKGSSQGALWILGGIFRYFWAVHQNMGVLSSLPNLDKVVQSWKKQGSRSVFRAKPQELSPSCALLAPPRSVPEGQGVVAQLPREWRVSLYYPRSLAFPKSCSPSPAGGKAINLVEASCGLGLAHRSWCWDRIRQIISNIFCVRMKSKGYNILLYISSVQYSKIKS